MMLSNGRRSPRMPFVSFCGALMKFWKNFIAGIQYRYSTFFFKLRSDVFFQIIPPFILFYFFLSSVFHAEYQNTIT